MCYFPILAKEKSIVKGEANPTNTPCPKRSQQLSIPPKFYAYAVFKVKMHAGLAQQTGLLQHFCTGWRGLVKGPAQSSKAG
jgi:hypothetical protein